MCPLKSTNQIPIYEARSDARDNLINSVIVAATSNIKEVLLCFGSEVFRGNRCVKNDNAHFAAFISPNHPAVMKLGVRFERDVGGDPPRMYPGRELAICKLPKDCKVGILYLYPGITLRTVERNIQNLKGVVLLSFGAGNAPTDKDFLDTLKDSTERGTLIINVTQCPKGAVNAAYETGQMLKGSGVVSGEDITTEAAYCKLCYLLGREDLTYEQRKRELGKPLRQEMTQGLVEVPEPMRERSPWLDCRSSGRTMLSSSFWRSQAWR
ncbi:hypothetical protein V1264_018327 [Littorina saxatilis]|uniref:asparaginase n=1 Tax=Littorina saxatilis TaxID=31220 RepID=A0AAN9BDA7_9CAEN